MILDKPVSTSGAAAPPEAIIGQLRAENLALRQELAELGIYRHLALQDALTGLHNRRSFDECLRREWSRWRRCAVPFALLAIDLDDFKAINDSFGHAVGDGVLRWFARALLRACRDLDVVCRIGGDEFVILLPATSLAGAEIMGQRLASAVARDSSAPRLPGHRAIGFSWGFCSTEQVEAPTELLRKADAAMYRHKRDRRRPGLAAGSPTEQTTIPWPIVQPLRPAEQATIPWQIVQPGLVGSPFDLPQDGAPFDRGSFDGAPVDGGDGPPAVA